MEVIETNKFEYAAREKIYNKLQEKSVEHIAVVEAVNRSWKQVLIVAIIVMFFP